MQLQEKHDDVVCISLNLDHNDPANPPQQELIQEVTEKLKKLKITVENVIASDARQNVLDHYGLDGGLPAVLVYGRDGRLRLSQGAGFEFDTEIEPLVAKLVAE